MALDRADGKPEIPARRDGEVAVERPRPTSFRATYVLEGTLSRGKDFWARLRSRISFWTVVLGATFLSAAYLFLFAESMFVSEAIINLQNKSITSGVSSVLGGMVGQSPTGNQDAALVTYIESPGMLKTLDAKFHLREIYSDYQRNPFWRLAKTASDEDFQIFYQGMIEIDLQHDVGIITLRVLDYDAVRAKAITETILAEAEAFMNRMSDTIREQTLRSARIELQEAMTQVAVARQSERTVAEQRLSSAQAAMATSLSLANQQQVFVVRISDPTLPSVTTRPERLLDLAAIALGAAILYAISFLLLANVRDHRRV